MTVTGTFNSVMRNTFYISFKYGDLEYLFVGRMEDDIPEREVPEVTVEISPLSQLPEGEESFEFQFNDSEEGGFRIDIPSMGIVIKGIPTVPAAYTSLSGTALWANSSG